MTTMPCDTTVVADRHLVDGMARGNAEALRALHQRHANTVYALAYGILVDPADADEVVAETFSYAWRAAARFVSNAQRSVAPWLSEIARSRAQGLMLARAWPERSSPPCGRGASITMIEEVG